VVGRCTQKVPLGSFSMFWTRAELVWCNPTIGSAERRQTLQRRVKDWSMTSLKEKLIKIGAKIVSHGRYVAFQIAEVAIPKNLFADILRMIAELRPPTNPAPA
jgi:Transposase DDE domain group 1